MFARRLLALSLSAALALWAMKAPAQSKRKVDPQQLSLELSSGEPARIEEALRTVAAERGRCLTLSPLIEGLLSRGLPVPLAVAAVQALASLGQPSSSRVVRPYARHREPSVRRAALLALPRIRGSHATAGLREGLRDPLSELRGLSAIGLLSIGARDAMDDLLAAVDHEVSEAALAVGGLCRAEECDGLTTRVGKARFIVLSGGLEVLLMRAEGVSIEQKEAMVAKVRATGREGRDFLRGMLRRRGAEIDGRLRGVIEAAAEGEKGAL